MNLHRSTSAGAFVRGNTDVGSSPLCPEITLHLATEMMPLWKSTEETLSVSDLPPPLWAFCWAGGQVLARYILDNPVIVRGKRVLDFATGGGVSAIAAAKAGALSVCANDADNFALAAAQANADLNGAEIETTGENLIGKENTGWDVVLAGDICYDRALAERAIPWLRTLVRAGTLVLLGDPGRPYLPADGLEELARYSAPTPLESEDAKIKEGVVWRVLA